LAIFAIWDGHRANNKRVRLLVVPGLVRRESLRAAREEREAAERADKHEAERYANESMYFDATSRRTIPRRCDEGPPRKGGVDAWLARSKEEVSV